MERRNLEILVGLFVVIGALALVFLSLKAANLASFSFDKTYTLTARFDNVGGLKVRAPVKSAGVTVGRIRSITFDDKNFQGVVTMEIDDRYQFPADTSAKILTSGLLGDQYIGLDPGGDEKNLKPGDSIKLTQSAVVLEDLIGKALYGKAAEGGGKQKENAK
ncbi:MAG TPA: outer membrane lipid asymmetry maintenance protein MlaD [Burkholderiaceae bacterium]|jgi:phospholipid/cholesterol/gamma-HCH transport system substrate-binding protein|nr:outer membrane lipid asymmetry maintenance protein MlaD [Burkholderiaceae bacterium]